MFGKIEGDSPLFSAKVWKEAALFGCNNVDMGFLANDEALRNRKYIKRPARNQHNPNSFTNSFVDKPNLISGIGTVPDHVNEASIVLED